MLSLLFALVALSAAREPTCAVLFCNEAQTAAAWIAGAQDEMIVMLEALFGGFNLRGERIGGCFEKTAVLDSLVCLTREDFPPARCYSKFCDFWRHSELFEDTRDLRQEIVMDNMGVNETEQELACRQPFTHPHESRSRGMMKQRVCRTVQAWAAIGIEKLYAAFDAQEAGRAANATSYACVAEKLLRLVTSRLPPSFDEEASYRHQVFPAKLAAFDLMGEATNSTADSSSSNNTTVDLLIGMRTVRSYRRALNAPTHVNHSLIATYVVARVLQRSRSEMETENRQGGVTELLWPVAGAIAPFDKSSLPATSVCALADQSTNLMQFDAARALPCLGPLDFAAVADQFPRCRTFPAARLRRYDDLLPSGCCSTIVLMADIRERGDGQRHEPHRASLGYVAHYRSRCSFEQLSVNSTTDNSTSTTTTTTTTGTTTPSPTSTSNGKCGVCPSTTGEDPGPCFTSTPVTFLNGVCVGNGSNVTCAIPNGASTPVPCMEVASPTNCTAGPNATCSCILETPRCVCTVFPRNADASPAAGRVCVPNNVSTSTPSPSPTPSSPPSVPVAAANDPGIESVLIARVAAPDACMDVVATTTMDQFTPPTTDNSTMDNNTTTTPSSNGTITTSNIGAAVTNTWWRPPRDGLPMTLAPGESRCVGGERAGDVCSLASECGAGRTCRVKPGSDAAYCYDTFAWAESEPCIYAGKLTECPYGYCYGAADGHDGGTYPLLHVFRSKRCDAENAVIADCPDEVMNWFDHPTIDSIQ